MEGDKQQPEAKVDMPVVCNKKTRHCVECYHSSGPYTFLWCGFYDKPTSGKTCDSFQRYAIKLPKWE
jgi:hypothetical protein